MFSGREQEIFLRPDSDLLYCENLKWSWPGCVSKGRTATLTSILLMWILPVKLNARVISMKPLLYFLHSLTKIVLQTFFLAKNLYQHTIFWPGRTNVYWYCRTKYCPIVPEGTCYVVIIGKIQSFVLFTQFSPYLKDETLTDNHLCQHS